jgi:hypothetical protein
VRPDWIKINQLFRKEKKWAIPKICNKLSRLGNLCFQSILKSQNRAKKPKLSGLTPIWAHTISVNYL